MAPILSRFSNVGGGGAGGFGFGRRKQSRGPSISPFSATGGSTSTPGDGYKYHVFDYPNSSNFVVTGDSGATVVNTTIEVLLQGAGGGGGGGDGNSGNSDGGTSGGGGATGVWSIPITVAGSYPVVVGNRGSGGNAGGGNGNTGGPSTLYYPFGPSYINAGGGGGGQPRGGAATAAGGGIDQPWATASLGLQGYSGSSPNGYSGSPGGDAGGTPQPSGLWWKPYMAPGAAGGGGGHGNPTSAGAGANYGGGGGSGAGSFDGGGSGPGREGGYGRVVIRYLL